jgi:hypothetical protein
MLMVMGLTLGRYDHYMPMSYNQVFMSQDALSVDAHRRTQGNRMGTAIGDLFHQLPPIASYLEQKAIAGSGLLRWNSRGDQTIHHHKKRAASQMPQGSPSSRVAIAF